MPEAKRRRPTLLDLMLLVASVGMGGAMARAFRHAQQQAGFPEEWDTLLNLAHPVLLAVTIGALVLRFLPPRPTLRRLARRPGFLALFTVAMMAILVTLEHLLNLLYPRRATGGLGFMDHDFYVVQYLSKVSDARTIGSLVALVWVMGWLQGLRWKYADWVEWLGRGLGVVWVGSWVAMLVRGFFG
jgi:hypothetical protein